MIPAHVSYKKYGDLIQKFGNNSIEELLETIWPLYMERQICLKEAMGVKTHQTSNAVDGTNDKDQQLK